MRFNVPRTILLLSLMITPALWAQNDFDLNVALMQSTFMLRGPDARGGTSIGTGFILFRPLPGAKLDAPNVTGKLVLVTAAHVFDEMVGDEAVILVRVHSVNSTLWSVVPARMKIREHGRPLWKNHPTADVAVVYVTPPIAGNELVIPFEERNVVPTTLLADDDLLKKNVVNPGLELKCLGYPLGSASNAAGFPVLRTGVIASYPLLPTAETKTFLFDFRVFKGNSGGPVYFSQSLPKGGTVLGGVPQFIMGLVSKEANFTTTVTDLYETRQTTYPLSIGEVVFASLIKEAIASLPSPETPEAAAGVVRIEVLPQGPPTTINRR